MQKKALKREVQEWMKMPPTVKKYVHIFVGFFFLAENEKALESSDFDRPIFFS